MGVVIQKKWGKIDTMLVERSPRNSSNSEAVQDC